MKIYHTQGVAPYFTNSFLVVGGNKQAVIIDATAPMEIYESLLQEHGAHLTHILLTHGHHDHVATVQALCAAHDVAVYLGEGDSHDNRLFPLKSGYMPYTDGETITVGDLAFRVIATPGHSAGSVCLLCDTVLFAGDTLFKGDVGRTDLQGSDPQAMLRSLQTLLALVPDGTQILPGHDAFSEMAYEKQHNPYLLQAAESV